MTIPNSPKSLKIMSANMNGLATKMHILKDSLKLHHWDILCISETHLLPHLPSAIVDIPDYSLLRHDSDGTVYKHGVCCYVHNRLLVDSVSQPMPNVLSFRLSVSNIFVLIVYRAPSNSNDSNEALNSFIVDFCSAKEVIVVGDFNLPSIDWSRSSLHCTPLDRMFLDTFTALGLNQWIDEPTYPKSGNILDLVLTSEPDRIGSLNVLAPLPGCDHCVISFDYIFDDLDGTPCLIHHPLETGTRAILNQWHANWVMLTGILN